MKELDSIKKGIEQLENTGARFLKILYEQNTKLHYENTELKETIKQLMFEIKGLKAQLRELRGESPEVS